MRAFKWILGFFGVDGGGLGGLVFTNGEEVELWRRWEMGYCL